MIRQTITPAPSAADDLTAVPRAQLWQQLSDTDPESDTLPALYAALLAPVVADLCRADDPAAIDGTALSVLLRAHDESGEKQEFILSRLWPALPVTHRVLSLKVAISQELNRLITINNQLAFSQFTIR